MDIIDFSKEKVVDLFKGNDNVQDIHNTQLAVLSRLIALMRRGSLRTPDFGLEGNPINEKFTDRFEDLVAGWASTFDVVVRNTMTIC